MDYADGKKESNESQWVERRKNKGEKSQQNNKNGICKSFRQTPIYSRLVFGNRIHIIFGLVEFHNHVLKKMNRY